MSGRETERPEVPYLRAIPRSTPWPLVTAFGVTFLFAGIVTNPAVSIVGAVAGIVGLVGWFREVLPGERTEEIPVEHAAGVGVVHRVADLREDPQLGLQHLWWKRLTVLADLDEQLAPGTTIDPLHHHPR